MGVLAARMCKTGKIGSVNGLEGLPNVVQQVGGFRKGAKSVKPDIEVKVIYIQNMEDAAMAKEAALASISGGADFVSGKLNAGAAGSSRPPRRRASYANGRSFGHVAAAPQNVLTASIEKWAEMYVGRCRRRPRPAQLKPELIDLRLRRTAARAPTCATAPNSKLQPGGAGRRGRRVEAVKRKLAAGELKISVTKEDARGGL